jgi:hypothetical protein
MAASNSATDLSVVPRSNGPFFSFEEIAKDKKVRITTINDEMYMSVVDFIMIIEEKNNNRAAEQYRTIKARNENKFTEYIKEYKFQGI